MIIDIPQRLLLRAIVALRYMAQNEAGQSQAPDLITREDTQEWADAETIKELIKKLPIATDDDLNKIEEFVR